MCFLYNFKFDLNLFSVDCCWVLEDIILIDWMFISICIVLVNLLWIFGLCIMIFFLIIIIGLIIDFLIFVIIDFFMFNVGIISVGFING